MYNYRLIIFLTLLIYTLSITGCSNNAYSDLYEYSVGNTVDFEGIEFTLDKCSQGTAYIKNGELYPIGNNNHRYVIWKVTIKNNTSNIYNALQGSYTYKDLYAQSKGTQEDSLQPLIIPEHIDTIEPGSEESFILYFLADRDWTCLIVDVKPNPNTGKTAIYGVTKSDVTY